MIFNNKTRTIVNGQQKVNIYFDNHIAVRFCENFPHCKVNKLYSIPQQEIC